MSWKTTLLGTVVITATLVSKFKYPDTVTWWPEAFVGITLGVVLWLAPDTIVDLLKRFLSNSPYQSIQNVGGGNAADDGDGKNEMVEPDN